MTDQYDERSWLRGCSGSLARQHDVGLLDLDGTVYTGEAAIPGAAEAVAAARQHGLRIGFVTNNAARSPEQVADHLSRIGLPAVPGDVVTSAQAAAGLLAGRLPRGSNVLVVGGAGLASAVTEAGLRPVTSADEDPVAVVQGWAPELGWALLAEGAYAVRRGLLWVATNTDLTLPTARGIAPGNGSFVALLAGVCGRQPDAIAGKPHAELLTRAAKRLAARQPLVVGDRLDTDIEGAAASELPSLLVLTGVSGVPELLAAPARRRPTYLAGDLSGLIGEHASPARQPDGGWTCGPWRAALTDGATLAVTRVDPTSPAGSGGSRFDGLRAACAAAWTAADEGRPVRWGDELAAELAAG